MAKAAAKTPVARSVESLKVLLSQVNALAPNRSKASDGWIGDVKHMARHSDHNPEPDGTVDARDFTNDPSNGCDARKLAQAILDSRDKRLSYVISNGQIASGRKGPQPWVWRKYNGSNGHYHHCHVSVLDEGQDDTTPWKIESAFSKPPVSLTTKQVNSVMRLGSTGEFVKTLQKNLNNLGYGPLVADGEFGEKTDKAVRMFQAHAGLDKVDGWAGPTTLEAIGKELSKLKLQPKINAAENKAAAAEKVVDNAAAGGKRFSATEWLAGIGGFTSTATIVNEGARAAKESTTSVIDLVSSIGPWVLLGLVVAGAAGYIIYERRKTRLEALAVQKVM